jgi:ABC-2 type transport system permease protein
MRGYTVLLIKELAEQWQTRRLPVVAVIFVLIGLGSPVLAKYTPDIVKLAASSIEIHVPTPTIEDAVDQLIKNLGQVGVLTAILLAMGSVAGEKASGTAAFVLVKPVSRLAFLGAKFSGLALTMGTAVLLCGFAAFLYTELLFGPLSVLGFGAACIVMLLGLLEIAAITFLGSTLVRSPVPAAGIGVVGLVIAGLVSSLPNIGHFTPFGLNQLASALVLQQATNAWAWPVIVNVGFVVVVLAGSWLVFRRQEI